MKTKWEERKIESAIRDELLVKQKREEIIQAASKVFAKKGYQKTTIGDISKVSGLGPGTIYNYVNYMQKILEDAKKRGIIGNRNARLAADIIVYLIAFIPLRRWNLKKRFNEKQIKNGIVEFILKELCLTEDGKAEFSTHF